MADDIRGELAAAFEEHSTEEIETPEVPETPETPETPEVPETPETPEQGRERDPQTGRFTKQPKAAKPETPQGTQPPKPETPQGTQPPAPAPRPADKAPQSWSPAEREHWAKVQPEVRAIINRREREIATAMQESAGARQLAGQFQNVVAPFWTMLQAEGVQHPLQAVQALLTTAYKLRSGSDSDRARQVAMIAKQFLPPGEAGIRALDDALVEVFQGGGAAPGQPGARPAPTRVNDPRLDRLDQLFARIDSADQTRQQAMANAGRQAVEEIQNEEFFPDVRLIMADMLDAAAARGLQLSVKDAYHRSCMVHPEEIGRAHV